MSKAAREFNVGTGTIVDFLKKKGITVESSPNTKLEPEVYDLIVAEFAQERKVKEEAEKIGLSYKEAEAVSIESTPTRKKEEEEEGEDLIIKEVGISHKPEETHPEETKKPEPETKKVSPSPKEEKKEETPAVAAKEKEPEEKGEKKEVSAATADKAPQESEEKKSDKPIEEQTEKAVVEAKTEESKITPEAKEEKEPQTESPAKTEEKASEAAEEAPPKEEALTKAAAETPAETEAPAGQEESPAAEAEETATGKGPKVVGKIDLTSIPGKRTAQKRKKETAKEKTERLKAEKAAAAEAAKARKEAAEAEAAADKPAAVPEKKPETDINFLKTEVQKLSGPTIVGRINLEDIQKKERKPVASSSDDKVKAKKKRKRIRKPAETAQDNKAATDKRSRDRKGPRKEEKPVLTDEEIQKQIKETLANLTSKTSGKGKALRAKKKRRAREEAAEAFAQEMESSSTLRLTEFVSVSELASLMDVTATEVIGKCMSMGVLVSINQRLDAETITVVADEFGYEVEFIKSDEEEDAKVEADDPAMLKPRNPIVTVMGHVDHGKTKLLDYIRNANVIAGEAGGITQHIGAYEVVLENGKAITFLDTPGHEAFTAMRARGAKVTDIAIIIIAADDAVMPQTVEAINHAKAAGVPIVIAINKVDKPNSNPEKIREQLANMNILVEEWGGKYQCQEISALKGLQVDDLLEKVLLEAEMLDLHANPDRLALGTVIESSLDKGRGYVAKMLVQNGTLHVGDVVLAGAHYGRVKAMYNERNQAVKEAGPAAPVLMLGLNGAPQAGDVFVVKEDEKEAKNVATKRQQLQREQGIRTKKHITLDEIGRRIAIGDFKELNIIVKGDVDGSVEALTDELLKLSTEEVQVNVIHKDVGAVKETDVSLASASNAIIVAFQVRPSVQARKMAEAEQIDIRLYSVIYDAVNEIKEAIAGMLTPKMVEKITCNIEVRETFKITKVGTIAGCYVLDGKVNRNTKIRVIRDGIVVYTGELGSLKRYKDDVKEVSAGYECGLNVHNFNDIKVGDIIEGYEIVEEARK